MPSAGQRDATKERHWRQVLVDWHATGLSGAEYCREKHLTYTQFNDWRKRLRKLDAEVENRNRHRRATAIPQGMTIRPPHQKPQRSVEFAEVQVVDREPQRAAMPIDKDATTLEVVFPDGVRLRLAAGCPTDLLSSVIALLENR